MISFCCQQCSREYKVDDKYAGRKARCKQCNHYNVIPKPESSAKSSASATISFVCESCGQKLRVKSKYAGRRVKCSTCGETCSIPYPQNQSQTADQVFSEAKEQSTVKTVKFNCQMCSAEMRADESQAGDVLECPECQCFVEVPGSNEEKADEGESFQDWEDKSADEDDFMPVDTRPASPSQKPKNKRNIPAAWKIPAAVGTSLALVMVVVVLWTIIAVATGFQWSIFITGIGGLAGAGLTVFTEKRNGLLGIAAVLITLFGIFTGKVMVVKYAVMPGVKHDIALLGKKSAKALKISARSKLAVRVSACMEMRDKGELSEELVWPVFYASQEKEADNLIDNEELEKELAFWKVAAVKIDPDLFRERKDEIKKGIKALGEYIAPLNDTQKSVIFGKHKAEINDSFINIILNVSFKRVFIASFGLFDLIFILVAIVTAFNLGAGLNGSKSY